MQDLEFPPASKPIEILGPDGLVLRQFFLDDAEELFELIDRNRDHLSQFGDETSKKYPTIHEVIQSIRHPAPENLDRLRFGIRGVNGTLMGTINLQPEKNDPEVATVGCWLGKEFTGHGYTALATSALSEYAFTHTDAKTLKADVVIGNEASRRTLENAGFNLTGQDVNHWYFELRKEDYYHSRQNIS